MCPLNPKLQALKEKYETVTDAHLGDMGKCDHAISKLVSTLDNGIEYYEKTSEKARKDYLKRTKEQKEKYALHSKMRYVKVKVKKNKWQNKKED